jgi:hypothetical protein
MKLKHTDEEPIYFDHCNPADLERIIDTQHKIAEYMKSHDHKQIHQILIVIDDFADSPQFTRQSKLLHALYIRGRHTYCSVIPATQVFSALSPVVIKNITDLYVFRLRNYKDLESLIEELSAIGDTKTLLEMYKIATSEPYGVLYIHMVAKSKKDMFYVNFDRKIVLSDE